MKVQRFERKPPIVEAVCFTGKRKSDLVEIAEHFGGIVEERWYLKSHKIEDRYQARFPHNRNISVCVGDWIVGNRYDFDAVTAADMNKYFIALDNDDDM